MSFKVKVEMDKTQKILLKRHLNKNGKAQKFLTGEIKRFSDPYVPMDSGVLKNASTAYTRVIVYRSIYARYQWYGRVMAGTPRRATGKGLRYQEAPKRGKEWTIRMWADRGDEIVRSVAKFVGGVAK